MIISLICYLLKVILFCSYIIYLYLIYLSSFFSPTNWSWLLQIAKMKITFSSHILNLFIFLSHEKITSFNTQSHSLSFYFSLFCIYCVITSPLFSPFFTQEVDTLLSLVIPFIGHIMIPCGF